MQVITINSKVYDFPKLNYESDKSYFLRKDFFIKANPTSEKKYLQAITLSICWASVEMYNCVYAENIMNEISKIMS